MLMLKQIEEQLDATPDKQISLTDPDARSMKTRGTGVVGYNVQVAVDAKSADHVRGMNHALNPPHVARHTTKAALSNHNKLPEKEHRKRNGDSQQRLARNGAQAKRHDRRH